MSNFLAKYTLCAQKLDIYRRMCFSRDIFSFLCGDLEYFWDSVWTLPVHIIFGTVHAVARTLSGTFTV